MNELDRIAKINQVLPAAVTVGLGELTMAEVAAPEQTKINVDGYLTSEFIASKEDRWVNSDGKVVWTVCGDERPTDETSNEQLVALEPDVLPVQEGGLSIYGQTVGIAKNLLLAGMAQYGEPFYDRVGGLDGAIDKVIRFSAADSGPGAFRPAQHSDASKEQLANGTDSKEFCPHGAGALGCAYCMGAGLVTSLVATNDLVFNTGKENIELLTGEADDFEVDALRQASAQLASKLGPNYSFGREQYAESGMPVQVLEGKPHLAAQDTGYIANLDPHTVGQAGDIYRGDVAGVALVIRRLFKEYDLRPSLLIKSQILEAAAVRAALASHDISGDTSADPRRIGFGVRGNTFRDALVEIARLEQSS